MSRRKNVAKILHIYISNSETLNLRYFENDVKHIWLQYELKSEWGNPVLYRSINQQLLQRRYSSTFSPDSPYPHTTAEAISLLHK